MPVIKTYKCGTCQQNVNKTQASILCKGCDCWFHTQCAKITDETLAVLKEVKSISFSCVKCQEEQNFSSDKAMRTELCTLNKKMDCFLQRNVEDIISIKKAFAEAVTDLKTELASCCKDLQSDIESCNKRIEEVNAVTTLKIAALEEENNVLHKRLNRGDIVINGLPKGLTDFTSLIISLCRFYNVPITSNDINYAHYMFNHKMILVKFNNVFIRDQLMDKYFKTKSLKLKDIIGGDIDERVYLNDHFTPADGKLNNLCRRLIRLKIIKKFRIIKSDKPKVKITPLDGNDEVYGFKECMLLLNANCDATVK